MRLFTGIDIPEAIKERLDVLISHLRPHAQIKWSPTYNLHITTKFIGEWPQDRLSEIDAALRAIQVGGPVSIEVRGLGWFPNPHSPRTFWAAIHASASLPDLVNATNHALAGVGIEVESKPFSPHLTLARIKEPVPLAHIRTAIAELDSLEFGSFTAPAFHLYRSEPGPTGSIYSKLQDYPLPQ